MGRPSKLTQQQQAFVDEYLCDLNATQAAIRAGYSEKTAAEQGCRLLVNVNVAKALSEAQKARSKRTGITADRVLAELAKIGFSDIRKVVRWGNTEVRAEVNAEGEVSMAPFHGIAVIDSSEIDDDTAAAISEVSQGKEGLKIKMHDKKGALVDIGRHLGMFVDKTEHTGKDGAPLIPSDPAHYTDEQLAAIVSAQSKAK